MARTVEELNALYAAAYQAKDADAVGALYADDAIYAQPFAGFTVVGRAAIVEKVKELFGAWRELDYEDDAPLLYHEEGDFAFVHCVFRVRVTLPDGTKRQREGRQSNVMRRGPDGNWQLILDHASAL
jgi:uncharacterized protein (TIGR02246 family)